MRGFLFCCLILVSSIAVAGNPPGHWSFPGDIQSHLRGHHGISTYGMSYEQMLNTHDRLHEMQRSYQHTVSKNRPTKQTRSYFFRFRR